MNSLREFKKIQKKLDALRVEKQKEQIEPLYYLRSIPYTEYRTSHWWKKRREEAVEESDQVCACCRQYQTIYDRKGELMEGLPRLHAHHVNYERLGEERPEDLVIVCSPCHNLIHFPESAAARYWVSCHIGEDEELENRATALRPR